MSIEELSTLCTYIHRIHDRTLADKEDGKCIQVWHDFEITSQKSGAPFGYRNIQTIHEGILGIKYEMPVVLGDGSSYACIPEDTISYIAEYIRRYEQHHEQSLPRLQDIIRDYNLEVRTEGSKSIILNPRGNLENKLLPYIKGLIFNHTTGMVVCPGVITPETITTPEEFDYDYNHYGIEFIEPAYDGVLFRVYYDRDLETWTASTNGQIKPKNGWGGGPSFDEMFNDPEIQSSIDYCLLNKAHCYYVVMEHPAHINIIPHFKARAILVDAVTIRRPFERVNIDTVEGFTHSICRQYPTSIDYTGQTLFDLVEQHKKNIGIIVHLKNDQRIRIESKHFRRMSSLRINIADVYKQWIHKLRRPAPGTMAGTVLDMLNQSEQDIIEYLKYFTWHTEKFNYMRQRFLEIYTALCQKIADKKTIIPKRLMKFYRELTPEQHTPEMILRKLIDAEEKHLFYLMNPYNSILKSDPQVNSREKI